MELAGLPAGPRAYHGLIFSYVKACSSSGALRSIRRTHEAGTCNACGRHNWKHDFAGIATVHGCKVAAGLQVVHWLGWLGGMHPVPCFTLHLQVCSSLAEC